jgi:formylglycine-generating enzyme required for sulfatase activity
MANVDTDSHGQVPSHGNLRAKSGSSGHSDLGAVHWLPISCVLRIVLVFRRLIISLLFISLALGTTSTRAVSLDTVLVGDPGNPPDQIYRDKGPFGSVDYLYRIGTTEVTNEQYAEFLNAVAASDPHELFHPRMHDDLSGGITQHGSDGNYSYTVRPNMGNKPVVYVSFWDAARFANWMNNGQPTGAQDEHTTEDGAYTLGGVTFPVNESVSRNPGATWFLPSEDEWYKAAYYDPRSQAEGGPPGDDNYWLYATRSDDDPIIATANSVGDISNPGPNVANYDWGADWNGRNGNVTTVGSAGLESTSYYGTYDQAGGVWEWNEAIVEEPSRSTEWTFRGSRGGTWDDPARLLRASTRGFGGIVHCGTIFQCFNSAVGFRMATFTNLDLVGDFNANGMLDVEDLDRLTEESRKFSDLAEFDLNSDGRVDQADRRIWVTELREIVFGDTDFNGIFGTSDLVAVFQVNEYEDGIAYNSTWAEGDWDGDGDFGSRDFVFVLRESDFEGRPGARVANVPESSARTLMVVSLLACAITVRLFSSQPVQPMNRR